MKNTFFSLGILTLILVSASCSKLNTRYGNADNPQIIVKSNYSFLKSAQLFIKAEQSRSPAYSALFDISNVERKKDTLDVTVSYLQGCEVNNFKVIWSGLALQTYPETIVLVVARTSGNCSPSGIVASQVLSINLAECLGDTSLAANARFIIANGSKTPDAANADVTISTGTVQSPYIISLDNANYICNIPYVGDTCFFQHLGDTLRIFGKVTEYGCGEHIAIITEKNDSILIKTSEIKPVGPDCNLAFNTCFQLRISEGTGYSVLKFDKKTYTGF